MSPAIPRADRADLAARVERVNAAALQPAASDVGGSVGGSNATPQPGWTWSDGGWNFGQGGAWVKPPPSWLTPEILGNDRYGIVDHIQVHAAMRHPRLADGPVAPEVFAGFISDQRSAWTAKADAVKVEQIRQAFGAWDHGYLDRGDAQREGVIQAKVVDDLQAGGVRGVVGFVEAVGYNAWNGFSFGHLGREDRSVGAYNAAQISAEQRAQERDANVTAASRDVILLASGAMAARVLSVAAEGQLAMTAANVTPGMVTGARVVMAGQATYSAEIAREGVERGDPLQAALGAVGVFASVAVASAPRAPAMTFADRVETVPLRPGLDTSAVIDEAVDLVRATSLTGPRLATATVEALPVAAAPVVAPASPSLSSAARAWQGSEKYPGVDVWDDAVLPKGTVLVAGSPGHAGFFTTVDALHASTLDAGALFGSMQVASRAGVYRPGVTLFEVIEDAPVALGKALANPHHGAGGAEQVFMPDFRARTREVVSILLRNRQAPP